MVHSKILGYYSKHLKRTFEREQGGFVHTIGIDNGEPAIVALALKIIYGKEASVEESDIDALLSTFFCLKMQEFPLHFAKTMKPSNSLVVFQAGFKEDIPERPELMRISFGRFPSDWKTDISFLIQLDYDKMSWLMAFMSREGKTGWN
jgi:hypothetical protein